MNPHSIRVAHASRTHAHALPASLVGAIVIAVLLLASMFSSRAQTFDPLSPVPDSQMVTDPPELSIYLSGSPGTNYTVTFHGRPKPPVVRPDFTLVALPDTQFYSASKNGGLPEHFAMQIEWIITNRVERNIVFVTQLGDITDYGHEESQWLNVTNAMYRLEDPVKTSLEHGIPYGITPGNHDMHWSPAGYRHEYPLYNKYFGAERFNGKPYYGGHCGSTNDNHFELISASGVDLIFLHLEFNAGVKSYVMSWANEVLQQYSDRRAIVISHSIMRQFDWSFNAEGQLIYDSLKANTNIFMMLCGHDPQPGVRADTYLGNTILTVKSDYDNATNGGNGWLRLMEFSPSNNVVRVTTYTPLSDEILVNPYHTFTLGCQLPLSPAYTNFAELATVTNVPSGVVSGGAWSNLLSATQYDWYVSATDGETVTKSAIWSFGTSADFPRSATSPPPALSIYRVIRQPNDNVTIRWHSVGGVRYRVEYSNGDPESGFVNQFVEIVRSEGEETDPLPPGTASAQEFTDDFSLTGGPPSSGARFYRVREIQ